MYVLLSLCYYSREVDDIVSQMATKGRRPSAFIAESLQSCGGQVQRWKQHPQPFFKHGTIMFTNRELKSVQNWAYTILKFIGHFGLSISEHCFSPYYKIQKSVFFYEIKQETKIRCRERKGKSKSNKKPKI